MSNEYRKVNISKTKYLAFSTNLYLPLFLSQLMMAPSFQFSGPIPFNTWRRLIPLLCLKLFKSFSYHLGKKGSCSYWPARSIPLLTVFLCLSGLTLYYSSHHSQCPRQTAFLTLFKEHHIAHSSALNLPFSMPGAFYLLVPTWFISSLFPMSLSQGHIPWSLCLKLLSSLNSLFPNHITTNNILYISYLCVCVCVLLVFQSLPLWECKFDESRVFS